MPPESAWTESTRAFVDFIEQLDAARHALKCSFRGAWFRGLSSTRHPLLPRLFRGTMTDEKDAHVDRATKLERDELKTKVKALGARSVKLGGIAKTLRSQVDRFSSDGSIVKLLKLLRQHTDTVEQIHANDRAIALIKNRLDSLELVYKSERESFDSYSFRSGATHISSWVTLAEMRHTGVPTRLLDWTENLQVAVYFAVEPYVEALQLSWEESRPKKPTAIDKGNSAPQVADYPFLSKVDLERQVAQWMSEQRKPAARLARIRSALGASPCVWIMNAIALAESVSGSERVWHVHQDPEFDYYRRFLIRKDWPFKKALPIYSPWKSPRIASQQGMFTVHGEDQRSLEQMLASSRKGTRNADGIVRQVPMNDDAVMGAAKHVLTFCGLDHFGLFRDPDSLATKIDSEFFGWQSRSS